MLQGLFIRATLKTIGMLLLSGVFAVLLLAGCGQRRGYYNGYGAAPPVVVVHHYGSGYGGYGGGPTVVHVYHHGFGGGYGGGRTVIVHHHY